MRAPLAIGGVLALLLLSLPLARLPMALSIDYNEGVNAYHAADAAAGKPLYTADLGAANYPPLAYHVVGAIGALAGDQVLAGRAVALASLFAIAACVAWSVRSLGAPRPAAALAALTTIGVVAALAPEYVAMNDHDLLAHAVALVAFAIYLRARDSIAPAPLAAVAALIAAALFVKQTVVALPLAMGWDLWRQSRRAFAIASIALAGCMAIGAAIMELSTGGRFAQDVLMPRELVLEHWIGLAGSTLLRLSPLVAVAFAAAWRAPREHAVVGAYLIVSLIAGLVLSAGAGTDVNFFFDLFFATAMALSLARFHVAGPIVLLFLAVAVPFRTLTPNRYRALVAQAAATHADVEFLSGVPGAALCENLVLCYRAGKPFAFDPYLVSEKVVGGRLPEARVVDLVASGQFHIVQLEHVAVDTSSSAGDGGSTVARRGRFTERTLAALVRHYRVIRASPDGVFYAANQVN